MRLLFIIVSSFSFTFASVMKYRYRQTVLIFFNLYLTLTLLFPRSSGDVSPYTCFERDNVPVDTEEIYEGHCEDSRGNKYQEQSTTTSCCECLM